MQCNRLRLFFRCACIASMGFCSFFLLLFLTLMSILFQLCFFFHFLFGSFAHRKPSPAAWVNCSRGEREYSCKKGSLLRAHKLSRESFYRFIRSTINRKKNRQEKQFMQDKRENYYKTSFLCAACSQLSMAQKAFAPLPPRVNATPISQETLENFPHLSLSSLLSSSVWAGIRDHDDTDNAKKSWERWRNCLPFSSGFIVCHLIMCIAMTAQQRWVG